RLAVAGLTGDQHRAVVPAEGEQVPAGVDDGDADRDTGRLGGPAGGGDEGFGVRGAERGDGGGSRGGHEGSPCDTSDVGRAGPAPVRAGTALAPRLPVPSGQWVRAAGRSADAGPVRAVPGAPARRSRAAETRASTRAAAAR